MQEKDKKKEDEEEKKKEEKRKRKRRRRPLYLDILFVIFIIISIIFIFFIFILYLFDLNIDIYNNYNKSIKNPECLKNEDCGNGICIYGLCSCLNKTKINGYYCPFNLTDDDYICFEKNLTHIYCTDDTCCYNGGSCWYGKCICINGWYGDHCENNSFIINPNNNCTSNSDCMYGTSISGNCYFGKCICEPNYYGDNCEYQRRDLSFCNNDSECHNGGICLMNDMGHGECYCLRETIGNNCENLFL